MSLAAETWRSLTTTCTLLLFLKSLLLLSLAFTLKRSSRFPLEFTCSFRHTRQILLDGVIQLLQPEQFILLFGKQIRLLANRLPLLLRFLDLRRMPRPLCLLNLVPYRLNFTQSKCHFNQIKYKARLNSIQIEL